MKVQRWWWRTRHLHWVLLLAWAYPGIIAGNEIPPPPNILLILASGLGWNDLGSYGSELATPAIDGISVRGARWTHWYAASPQSTPSRYGLITGRHPWPRHTSLHEDLLFGHPNHRNSGLAETDVTIGEVLKGLGYRTAWIGKWHLGHGGVTALPTRHGFGFFYGHPSGQVDLLNLQAMGTPNLFQNEEWMQEPRGPSLELWKDAALQWLKARPREHPFFLVLSTDLPGPGWILSRSGVPSARLQGPAAGAESPDPDTPRKRFARGMKALDDLVRSLLEELDSQQITRDTLVIFTSDRGGDPEFGSSLLPFPGGAGTLHEGSLRVPCLMQWPSWVDANQVRIEPASHLDLLPTLIAATTLCGLKPVTPPHLNGTNLMPLFLGNSLPERSLVWILPNAAAIRTGPWKLLLEDGKPPFLHHAVYDPYERRDLSGRRPDTLAQLRLNLQQAVQDSRTLQPPSNRLLILPATP